MMYDIIIDILDYWERENQFHIKSLSQLYVYMSLK